MGFYTKIEATIQLKPEWIPLIAKLNAAEVSWESLVPDHPWLDHYSKCERASYIPFGGGSKDPKRKLVGDIWDFECQLQNYDDEIKTFTEEVIPQIALSLPCFDTCDEDGWCFEYQMVDGVVTVKERYNKYQSLIN